MNKKINIITLGDIFKNLETREKAFEFLKYIKELQEENKKLKENNKKKTSRCTERNHQIRCRDRKLERRDKKIKKYKEVLDKIKEYCNHKLEMLELQKRNIMQILTPENGYLKTDIEIEMQKYKDILELLEEIE